MTKEERFDAVMQKLRTAPKVEFHIDAIGTFCMVAAMRVALSHPSLKGPMKSIVCGLAASLSAALINGEPDLKEFMEEMLPIPNDPENQQAVSE